jgi:hypothetical protein
MTIACLVFPKAGAYRQKVEVIAQALVAIALKFARGPLSIIRQMNDVSILGTKLSHV